MKIWGKKQIFDWLGFYKITSVIQRGNLVEYLENVYKSTQV